jgi:hypothetical protein
MKYRDVELYYQQALDDVGTKIIDLRTTDPISAIRLQFFGTNGATSCKDNRLNDVITKIELVDGSDQLLSLTLKEAQALEFRRTGKMPYMRPGEKASGGQEESTLILFGRHLWDKEYYMDLTKFRNPQLKITTNIAAVAAASATAFLAGSLKVTIDLLIIQEGAEAAKGFFMAKNIYGFTAGTSGDEHIDMPMDYPYAGLMVRAFVAGNDINENISKLKINCDAGKFIPLEKYVKDLWKAEEQDLGPAELRYNIFRAHDATVTHDLNHDPVVSVIPISAGLIANIGWSWSSRFYLSLLTHAGANQTDAVELGLIVKGACPHSTIYVPFGLKDDPATYFDPKGFGDIDLVLTQAAASAVAVVLLQLRPYGAAA